MSDKLTEALAWEDVPLKELGAAWERWQAFPTDDDVETAMETARRTGRWVFRSDMRTVLEAVKREDR